MTITKRTSVMLALVLVLFSHGALAFPTLLDVQNRLYQLGYVPGNLGGTKDVQTENAVREFQIANNLFPSNGQIDEQTLAKLFGQPTARLQTEVITSGQAASELNSGIPVQPALPQELASVDANRDTRATDSLLSRVRIGVNAVVGASTGDQDISSALEDEEASVDAGGVLSLGVAVNLSFDQQPYSAEISVGYKADRDSRRGAKKEFSRHPISIVGYYGNQKFRIGAGIVSHRSARYESSTLPASQSSTNEFGYTMRLDYRPSRFSGFFYGVAYENIDYHFEDIGHRRVNGNNVQAHLGYGLW